MSNMEERATLQRQIWQIADEVRGAVDGWDFKQYVLGTLFYRFISEDFEVTVNGDDPDSDFGGMKDEDIPKDIIEELIQSKGYYIAPSQLFKNVLDSAPENPDLNVDLYNVFQAIQNSAVGYAAEDKIKGLFADFDTTSSRLGNNVSSKNKRLLAVLQGVGSLKLGGPQEQQIDLFGDAYEFLISNYAANAGKSGGEFFTPQSVSKLLTKLASSGQRKINKVYDPACGSGSLLLQIRKQLGKNATQDGYFGQEINHTTYNLARMNMFLHGINFDRFNIRLGDTLLHPEHMDDQPFDVIVSNPPYSIKWVGSDDPTLINDPRFAPASVLAPKSKADFAFVLHALHHLSAKGRAAIVCFPGIFYRSGAEKKIRRYLIERNFVETVLSLPPNLFFGTSIAVNILVLSKHKEDDRIQFIDASGEDFFKKVTNNNILLDEHIDKIMGLFEKKEEVRYLSKMASFDEVKKNDFTLSVNSYVEVKDTREVIDIQKVHEELELTAQNIDRLRKDIALIVKEIEASEAAGI